MKHRAVAWMLSGCLTMRVLWRFGWQERAPPPPAALSDKKRRGCSTLRLQTISRAEPWARQMASTLVGVLGPYVRLAAGPSMLLGAAMSCPSPFSSTTMGCRRSAVV
jgi:hypothetical protein